MPRYERGDKFFTIELERYTPQYTVTSGTIGGPSVSTRIRSFSSFVVAEQERDKLVAKKLAAGFRLASSAAKASPRSTKAKVKPARQRTR